MPWKQSIPPLEQGPKTPEEELLELEEDWEEVVENWTMELSLVEPLRPLKMKAELEEGSNTEEEPALLLGSSIELNWADLVSGSKSIILELLVPPKRKALLLVESQIAEER